MEWYWWSIIVSLWVLCSLFQIFGGWANDEFKYGECRTLFHYKMYPDVNWVGKIFFILLWTVLIGPVAVIGHIVIFLNWLFHVGVKDN